MNNIITAIDIGSCKVTGVSAIITDEGKVHVLAASQTDSKGVEEGVIHNIDCTVQAINKVISNLNYKTDTEIKEVYVGISGRSLDIFTRTDNYIRSKSDTEITQEELDEFTARLNNILLSPGQVIVDVIPYMYNVDNTISTKIPVGMHGKELKGFFKIVTCDQKNRSNINRCFEKAGLVIKGIVLSAEAAAYACLSEQEMNAGAVVVDIGAGMTDIAFFNDGVLANINLVPIGGNIITSDIQDGCRILETKAEKLKKRFGSAIVEESQKGLQISIDGVSQKDTREISMLSLAQIIEARVDDISSLVNQAILDSNLKDKLLAGVVITGGTANLNNIEEHFEEALCMTTRLGQLKGFTATDKIMKQMDNSYATAYGIIAKIVSKTDVESLTKLNRIEQIDETEDIPKETSRNFFHRLLNKWSKATEVTPNTWN